MPTLFDPSQAFSRILYPLVFAALLAATPISAQSALDGLLGRLLEVQQNEAASQQELEEATALVARIIEDFPASAAAVSIIRGEPYDGIDFSSFEARLQATSAAGETTSAGQLPTFFVGAAPAPAVSADCISTAFSPSAKTAMQINVSLLPDGILQGLPTLMVPATPDQAVRADYIGLIGAIEGCTPLDWGAAGEYMLAIAETGTISIEPPAATEQVAAAPIAPLPAVPAPDLAPAPDAAPEAAPAFPTFQVAPQEPLAGTAVAPAPAGQLPTFLTPTAIPLATPDTEDLMALDRQAIRDIQARLLVSGFDPNGVDGVLGRGARAALTSWQASVGAEPSGYINTEQMDILRQQSQAPLELWLAEPGNASVYKPPAAAPKAKRTAKKKKRVRVCNRNTLGILYNCRYVLR